jgi:predicted kinase
MVGIPGSGKSYFAEQFAESFNAPIISFAQIQKELRAEDQTSNEDQEIIAKVASYLLGELFKTRQSIVFDGFSEQRTDRALLMKIAHSAGYEPLFIWVQTDVPGAKQRATKSKTGVSISSEEFEASMRRFSPPHPTERSVVISGKHTYASQLKNVLKRLVEPRAELTTKQIISDRPRVSGRNIIIR